MNRISLYNEAKKKLEELAEYQGVDINKYYTPPTPQQIRNDLAKKNISVAKSDNSDFDIPALFYLFCGHLSDRQFMGNIIKFYHYNSDTQKIMGEVLFGYDPKKTIDRYNSADALMTEIEKRYPYKIKNENKWTEYLNGIYQCAQWMSNNCLPNEKFEFSVIQSMLNSCDSKTDIREMLYQIRPVWYKYKHLTGVGAAVCYNWLKECGAVWLAKPDLHIKRVVAELLKKDLKFEEYEEIEKSKEDMTAIAEKIIDKYLEINPVKKRFPKGINGSCKLTKDEFIAVYMWEWAKEIREAKIDGDEKCTAYKLDRILYLYCTNGRFYLDDKYNISEGNLLEMISDDI